jgi:tRNA1(Val) A37 N6-methylase TrmN6
MPAARLVTVEAQAESVALAKKSTEWNGIQDRVDIRLGDFRDANVVRDDEKFELVLGSPPYFPLGTGIESEHPQKVACRFEMRGNIADYCKTAAKHLAPAGWFACVFPVIPEAQHQRVKDAARESGLTIVRWRPVTLREGEPPLLGLFAMLRSIDLPEDMRDRTWTEPPLIIRTKTGEVHPEYRAVKLSFGFRS